LNEKDGGAGAGEVEDDVDTAVEDRDDNNEDVNEVEEEVGRGLFCMNDDE